MNTIGERINSRRKELGLTQKQLAEKLHVSDKTVSRWETGRQIPDALTMQDIANALEMTVSELYAAEGNTQAEKQSMEAEAVLFKKIRKIFCLGMVIALLLVIIGFCFANWSLTAQLSCKTEVFPMYQLTAYDQSVVEWIESSKQSGDELSHLSRLSGDTAYYLFYLPRGSEATRVDYSYNYGLRGRVLSMNFKNLSQEAEDEHYLCYVKFPCEDIFILKTYIDGKRVDSQYHGGAKFAELCEMIF